MQLVSFGKITVTTSGTPVAVTVDQGLFASKITFRPASANSGITKVLDNAGNIAAELQKPASGHTDEFCVGGGDGGNSVQLSQFKLDAATSGDGMYVSYEVK